MTPDELSSAVIADILLLLIIGGKKL